MADNLIFLHVSSAVVMAWPEYSDTVAHRIAAMPDTEVAYAEGSRIIVVMEARDGGEIGARLAEISAIEGVLAANLAFEHTETPTSGEEPA
jgi:nitrate reductase NapD